MKNLGTRVNLLTERVSESDAVDKAKGVASGIAHSVAEVSGFVAWKLTKLVRLGKVRERIVRSYQEYRDELNIEE